MATVDKAITDLTAAEELQTDDLLVVEQDQQPKKMSGQVFMNFLLKHIDGHGGILDVQHTKTIGLEKTYALIMADGQQLAFTVSNGEKGDPGEADHVWFKWSSTNPDEDPNATIGDIPDAWIGIYTGIQASAPALASSYKWFLWKGRQGDIGPAPQLLIGNVTTIPYDEPASASISGSKENPVLNLRIPEGRPGADGDYSSDWAENYSGNPGYVANRTHFVKKDSAFVFAVDVELGSGNTIFSFSMASEVDYGSVYSVEFNGEVYHCRSQDIVAVLGAHAPALGNLYLLSREFEDTGEPFVIYLDGSNGTMQAPGYEGQTVSLKVTRDEIVKKLDNKYLDAEWTATKTSTGVAGPILDYPIQFTTGSAIVNKIANNSLVKGGRYTVTWAGTAYECTCIIDSDGSVYLGNPELASFQTDDGNPEAPFCFVSFGAAAMVFKDTDTAETVAAKIVGHRETSLEKLPAEFLPDTLYITSPNGTKFKITVDDSGNLTTATA